MNARGGRGGVSVNGTVHLHSLFQVNLFQVNPLIAHTFLNTLWFCVMKPT